MASTWKKVVTEGSKADLSSLIIPSSREAQSLTKYYYIYKLMGIYGY